MTHPGVRPTGKAVALTALAALTALSAALGACQDTETSGETYVHEVLTTGVGDNVYSGDPPGSSTVLPREYPGAPPLIPHSTEGLQVTADRNDCVDCHRLGVSFGAGHAATLIPESHYVDVPTGERSEDIQPIRYECLLCHLPQSPEEAPLQ